MDFFLLVTSLTVLWFRCIFLLPFFLFLPSSKLRVSVMNSFLWKLKFNEDIEFAEMRLVSGSANGFGRTWTKIRSARDDKFGAEYFRYRSSWHCFQIRFLYCVWFYRNFGKIFRGNIVTRPEQRCTNLKRIACSGLPSVFFFFEK